MNARRVLLFLVVGIVAVAISFVAVHAFFAIYAVNQYYNAIERGRCSGFENATTPEEKADLAGIPLLTFTYVPEQLPANPRVSPRTYYPIDRAVCGLRYSFYEYHFYQDEVLQIQVSIYEEQSENHIDESLDGVAITNCSNYNEGFHWKSYCVGDLSDSQGTYHFEVVAQYGVEVTEKVVRGMTVSDNHN
jgi:hypothetical protein